jgi:hypothetical protein
MYEMQIPETILRELEPSIRAATSYEMLADTLRPYFLEMAEINERMQYDLSLRQLPDFGKMMDGMWRNYDYFA